MTTETGDAPDEDYREFVRDRAAALHRTAYLLCGDWHLANDLVQETLAKAYRHWRRVRGADNPAAYVHRILINETNRYLRRHSRIDRTTDATGVERITPDPSDAVVHRADLLLALLELPLRQRTTVVLRHLVGMTEAETASAMRCSEGTVKSQNSRALNSLKTHLTQEEQYR